MTAATSITAIRPVVEVRAVHRQYRGSPPVDALAGVDLVVSAGEMVAVTGPSGSGKSTLLNIMGTLDRPTEGKVFVEGADTSAMSDHKLSGMRAARLGFVFQSFHLLHKLSATDNVATGLLYRGVSGRERKRRAQQALKQVGLGHRLKALPPTLSGGERQRVAIARAIVGRPALVLADEPTGNLDTTTGSGIIELLSELNDGGATIVVITHNTELADRMPRRVDVRDGRIR